MFFLSLFLGCLSEDVDYWVEPDNVGEWAGDEPKPSVQLWDICDNIALGVLMILMIRIRAIFNMIGPAIRYYRINQLINCYHNISIYDSAQVV